MRTTRALLISLPALVAAQAVDSDSSITIALGVTAFVSLLLGALLTLLVDKAAAKFFPVPVPAPPAPPSPAPPAAPPKPVMHDAACETDTILVVLLPQGPERALDRAALASRVADAVAGRQPAFRSPVAAAEGFGAFAPPPPAAGEEKGSEAPPDSRTPASPSVALPVSAAFEQAWVSRGIGSGDSFRLPSPPIRLASPLFPPSPATPHSPMRFGRWDSSTSNAPNGLHSGHMAASQALVGGLSQWSVQHVELEAPIEEPAAAVEETPAAVEVPVEPMAGVWGSVAEGEGGEEELALSVGGEEEEEEARGDIMIDVLPSVAEEEVEAPVTAISPNSLPSSPRQGSSSSSAADAAFASATASPAPVAPASYETYVTAQADAEEMVSEDGEPWIETVATLPGVPAAAAAAEEDRAAFVIDGQNFNASVEEEEEEEEEEEAVRASEREEGGFALASPLAPSPDRSHYKGAGRRTSSGAHSRTLTPLTSPSGTRGTRRPLVAPPDLSTRIAAHLSALTLVRPGAHPPAEILISPLANSPYLQHLQPPRGRPGSARPRSRG